MYKKFFKRFLDVIFSLILIVILSPLILITYLITLLHIGKPIFDIRFPREGKNKKPFYMLNLSLMMMLKWLVHMLDSLKEEN